jgi:hypothetical protein
VGTQATWEGVPDRRRSCILVGIPAGWEIPTVPLALPGSKLVLHGGSGPSSSRRPLWWESLRGTAGHHRGRALIGPPAPGRNGRSSGQEVPPTERQQPQHPASDGDHQVERRIADGIGAGIDELLEVEVVEG